MAKDPFQQLRVIKKASKEGKRINDCYRLLYKKELWEHAYYMLSTNEAEKLRQIPHHEIDTIIAALKEESFRLAKSMPCGTDFKHSTENMLLYIINIILTAVYEPILVHCKQNHAAAIASVKKHFADAAWYITVDFKGSHVKWNKTVFIGQVSQKIDDPRFMRILHHILVNSPVPSILSSLFINIYLHMLDEFVVTLRKDLRYIRFGDCLLLGVSGSKQDCSAIKDVMTEFVQRKLCLNLYDEHFQMTYCQHPVIFLGYEIKQISSSIQVNIPKKRLYEIARKNGYGCLQTVSSVHRTKLLNLSESDILLIYRRELMGIVNDYLFADNFQQLHPFFYLAKNSFIKTIACKRKSTMKKTIQSMRIGKHEHLCVSAQSKSGNLKRIAFPEFKDFKRCRKTANNSHFLS